MSLTEFAAILYKMTASELHEILLGRDEIALLDVREACDFVGGHINLACHLPLSRLELDAPVLVPRLGAPIVLCDATGGRGDFAVRSSEILTRLGYTDVAVLEGGIGAWVQSGFATSKGYGTYVRAFADEARKRYSVPMVTPHELRARLKEGKPTTVIDARPASEYAFASIPEARNYPGVELATRSLTSTNPDHLWVVNCFSRTRGIIGTASVNLLKEVENVAFLEDGVMAWFSSGFETAQGAAAVDDIPEESERALATRAEQIISAYRLNVITPEVLDRWRTDSDRSLYVFDVRLKEDPRLCSEAGVVHVPGGQLLMHYDANVATRRARLVLIDDEDLLRAAVSAFWLTQLADAEVYILRGQPCPLPESSAPNNKSRTGGPSLSVEELATLLMKNRVVVVDVGRSLDYVNAHLRGAYYLVASSLPSLDSKRFDKPIVFVSTDGQAAELAARDALHLGIASAGWLRGGTLAWNSSNQPVESGWSPERLLTPFLDDWGSVMRLAPEQRETVYPEFLRWERAVASHVRKDDTVRFRFFD